MALYTICRPAFVQPVSKSQWTSSAAKWQGYMEKIREKLAGSHSAGGYGRDRRRYFLGNQSSAEPAGFSDVYPICREKKSSERAIMTSGGRTVKKMKRFFEENQIKNIDFLFNNCFIYDNIGICGTRGWFLRGRFQGKPRRKDLSAGASPAGTLVSRPRKAQGAEEIYCFLHYPPVFTSFRCGEIIDLMHRYQVEQCIYGHLHSDSLRYAVTGIHEGINFRLVSGDYIDFMPVLLKK